MKRLSRSQTRLQPLSPPRVPEPVEQGVEAVEQAVQQVQPVNVNISVRVDSPGDNGAVTQINAALSQPLPVATPPEVRYQEPDPQYHDPLAANARFGGAGSTRRSRSGGRRSRDSC